MKKLLFLVMTLIMMTACSGTAGSPPPPPGTPGSGSEDLSDIISQLEEVLGPAPADVVGFAAGYKKNAPITGTENNALLTFYRNKAKTFITYNLDCPATVTADDMVNYNDQEENLANTGYGNGNKQWSGRAGYNKYDRLGNLDDSIGKTEIAIVSMDKSLKRYSSSNAEALVSAGNFYAYWIISLPDDNDLTGTVFNKGADNRQEPVKKGVLRFKRIGPGPDSVDVKVNVQRDGTYESKGELTAGHYEVSFDAKDGKKVMILNKNWLYIPSDTPEKDWTALVRNTYHIIYDCEAYIAEKPYRIHMEWNDIPIDWKVSSDEALAYGKEAGYMGTYCTTYDYFNTEEALGKASQDADDESETEITPGYLPTVFKETPLEGDGQLIKMIEPPTLSFYRGAEDSNYMEGAHYVDMCYELALYAGGQKLDVPFFPGAVFSPEWVSHEAQLEPSFQELARFGRLDGKKATDLIDNGLPMEIKYTYPDGAFIKMVIKLQE